MAAGRITDDDVISASWQSRLTSCSLILPKRDRHLLRGHRPISTAYFTCPPAKTILPPRHTPKVNKLPEKNSISFAQRSCHPTSKVRTRDTMCNESERDAGFAFAILTELALFAFFFFFSFYVLSKVSRPAISIILFIAAPVLLCLATVTLASLNDCIVAVTLSVVAKPFIHVIYAFSTALRALLLGLFVVVLIVFNRFALHGDWLFRDVDRTDADRCISPCGQIRTPPKSAV